MAGSCGLGERLRLFISVEKSDDKQKLGVRAAFRSGKVTITDIDDDGIIPDWNKAHPDKQIQVGDTFERINDVTISTKSEFGAEFARSMKVDLTIVKAQAGDHSQVGASSSSQSPRQSRRTSKNDRDRPRVGERVVIVMESNVRPGQDGLLFQCQRGPRPFGVYFEDGDVRWFAADKVQRSQDMSKWRGEEIIGRQVQVISDRGEIERLYQLGCGTCLMHQWMAWGRPDPQEALGQAGQAGKISSCDTPSHAYWVEFAGGSACFPHRCLQLLD